jgi:effector-binding domain-containing protein
MVMSSEPRVESRGEQPYIAIRATVTMAEIPVVLPPLIPEVYHWLQEQGVEPTGDVFFRYLSLDNGALQVDVGVPVAAALRGDERVRPGVFPAGRYVATTYTGPYEGLRHAWQVLEAWKVQNGIDGTGPRAEFYVTDPAEETDPQKWVTELVVQAW